MIFGGRLLKHFSPFYPSFIEDKEAAKISKESDNGDNSSQATPSAAQFTLFWDVENVQIPKGLEAKDVVEKLKLFLKDEWNLTSGTMTAIGNKNTFGKYFKSSSAGKDGVERGDETTFISKSDKDIHQTRTATTDIGPLKCDASNLDIKLNFHKLQSSKKSAADIALMGEIARLIYHRKPPHTIILVSGDGDFKQILSLLQSLHYKVYIISRTDSTSFKEQLATGDNAIFSSHIPWDAILQVESQVQVGDERHSDNEEDPLPKYLVKSKTIKGSMTEFRHSISYLVPELSIQAGIKEEHFFKKGGKRAILQYIGECKRIIATIEPQLLEQKKYESKRMKKLTNSIFFDVLHNLSLYLSVNKKSLVLHNGKNALRMMLFGAKKLEKNLAVLWPSINGNFQLTSSKQRNKFYNNHRFKNMSRAMSTIRFRRFR